MFLLDWQQLSLSSLPPQKVVFCRPADSGRAANQTCPLSVWSRWFSPWNYSSSGQRNKKISMWWLWKQVQTCCYDIRKENSAEPFMTSEERQALIQQLHSCDNQRSSIASLGRVEKELLNSLLCPFQVYLGCCSVW